jgi:hypothetical protein
MEDTIDYAHISDAGILSLKQRRSQEGKHLNELLRSPEHIAKYLLTRYERNCLSWYYDNFDFQCRYHKEHVIKSYHSYKHVPLGIKEVEQYVLFKAAYELKTCIDAIYETSGITNNHDIETTRIHNYCIENFMDNIYVFQLNKKGTTNQLSTSLLHKEELLLPWKVLIFCMKKKMNKP